MGILQRLLSPEYRRARAAETAGDFGAAARSYARCGERARAASAMLRGAETAPSEDERIDALRGALRFAPARAAARREAATALAHALLHCAQRDRGTAESSRARLREAASLLGDAGDFSALADCLLLLGDEEAAAAALERGGQVERLEELLARRAELRQRQRAIADNYAEYESCLATGERRRALASIRSCTELAAGDRSYRRLAEALEARLLHGPRVVLRAGAATTTYCGRLPVAMGRDPACPFALRDPGVSRRHAELRRDESGALVLVDLGARNGTRLGGVPLEPGAEVPLAERMEIGLGDSLALRVSSLAAGVARLAVERGLDRGAVLVCGDGALPLGAACAGPGATVLLGEGPPRIAPAPGGSLRLGDQALAVPVELLRGDRLVVDGADLEVL